MSREVEVRTRRCGCRAEPRRRCESCDPARVIFLACSARCLARHRADEHGGAAATGSQLRAKTEALNQTRDAFELYETHRTRLGRILHAAQRGEGLCVLGAGNCDDLDLPALARAFQQVHLVDLDGAALARATARVDERTRARLFTHAGLDLSGTVDRIERWGDAFPAEAELSAFAAEVAGAIARAIGQKFDVVLSSCLLSQLYLPLRETLLLGMADWQRLFRAVDQAHLATVAALTRSGGTGLLALDVVSSHKLPGLKSFATPESWDGLGATVQAGIEKLKLTLDPDPHRLLRELSAPPLADEVERPRLLDPWVWNTGGDVFALVYALMFTRA